jgi:hypothetical protein
MTECPDGDLAAERSNTGFDFSNPIDQGINVLMCPRAKIADATSSSKAFILLNAIFQSNEQTKPALHAASILCV